MAATVLHVIETGGPGLEVEILHARERLIRSVLRVPMQNIDGVVAIELFLKRATEKPATQIIAQDRDAVKVTFHRVARERLKRGLGAKHLE